MYAQVHIRSKITVSRLWKLKIADYKGKKVTKQELWLNFHKLFLSYSLATHSLPVKRKMRFFFLDSRRRLSCQRMVIAARSLQRQIIIHTFLSHSSPLTSQMPMLMVRVSLVAQKAAASRWGRSAVLFLSWTSKGSSVELSLHLPSGVLTFPVRVNYLIKEASF